MAVKRRCNSCARYDLARKTMTEMLSPPPACLASLTPCLASLTHGRVAVRLSRENRMREAILTSSSLVVTASLQNRSVLPASNWHGIARLFKRFAPAGR